MAASLNLRFGQQTDLTPGASGQFDIIVDGQLIFSKAAIGRFPVEGEVEALFAKRKTGG